MRPHITLRFLSIALDSTGSLYLLQMKEGLRLTDRDRDAACAHRETLLTNRTENSNHHGVFRTLAVVDLMMDGTVYQGRLFHYRGESADLRTTDGKWVLFKLEDPEDYRPLEVPLMPDGLLQLVSVEEFRDLIASRCTPTD